MNLKHNNEVQRTVAIVTSPDEIVEVDAIIDKGKKLRGSLDGLSKEELIAKYNEPLADDENGTYFANQKLLRAIEFVLLEKKMMSVPIVIPTEVEESLSDKKTLPRRRPYPRPLFFFRLSFYISPSLDRKPRPNPSCIF